MMKIDKNKINSWLRINKKLPRKGKIAKIYAKRKSEDDTPNKQY